MEKQMFEGKLIALSVHWESRIRLRIFNLWPKWNIPVRAGTHGEIDCMTLVLSSHNFEKQKKKKNA